MVSISFYVLSMMTSCYPNENAPHAHFPSRIPHAKQLFKVFVVLAY